MKIRLSYVEHTSDFIKTLLIIGAGLVISLAGLVIARVSPSLPMLAISILALILTIFILRSPYWGMVLLVFLIPLIQILPDVPIFTSMTMVIGGLTLISLLLRNLILGKRFHLTNKWFYLTVGLLVIVMLFGQINLQVDVGRNYFLTFFQLAVLVFLCDQLFTNKKEIETLMLVYILAVQISALFAFFDYMTNLNSFLPYEFRPTGLVGNSNGLGIHLSVSMVMAYYFLRNSENRSIRFLTVASFVFSGIMLFISGSRGAFLFFIPVALYQIIYDHRGGRLVGALIILMVAIMAMNFLPAEYLDRMVQIPTALENTSDTIRLRLNIWDVAIRLWSQNPVFGIGPGMFYYSTNQDFGLLGRSGLATHNMYITFLTENGIIGLADYLCIVLISIILFFKTISWAKRINPSWVALVVAWQSAFFIQLLNGTKANGGHDKIQWLCLGISLALWHLVQEYVKSQRHPAIE
jgi:putative inorganic carbon (hco3(-)) transporter